MQAGATAPLSRRERQVMDALYRLERATVSELERELSGEMSYSAVRSVLRVLVHKGQVKREEEKQRYVYSPAVSREKARGRALDHVVKTFFDGSVEEAAVALLRLGDVKARQAELERLVARIREAEREGR